MKDIFDLEIERFQAISDEEFRTEIFYAWIHGDKHSILFNCIGSTDDGIAGCLTQIRMGFGKAYINGKIDEALTEAIREDERLPYDTAITKESLPVFAEWQRKVKAMQNNL